MSMREDFAEAFKQHEEDVEDVVEETVAQEASPEQEQHEEQTEAETPTEIEAADGTSVEENVGATDSNEDEDYQPDASKLNIEKPPVSWKPANREFWKELPKEVREQIATRERQIMDGLENGKENRKAGERFHEIANKFHAVIAAEGISDPLQGFEGLMQSIAGLRMGGVEQKANIVAQMIKNYNVDLTALDNVLAAQYAGKPAPQSEEARLNAMLEQRLAPYNQFMQNIEQQKQQAADRQYQQYQQETAEFGRTHEFFEDARMEMADLIEHATQQGRNMTLEQAYNIVVNTNPDIQEAMRVRRDRESMASKREAASSVVGRKVGTAAPQPDTLRDALMQAMDG